MLVQKLSNVASQGSDEVLLEEFAKLGKVFRKYSDNFSKLLRINSGNS